MENQEFKVGDKVIIHQHPYIPHRFIGTIFSDMLESHGIVVLEEYREYNVYKRHLIKATPLDELL
jgi:hypothetical protein